MRVATKLRIGSVAGVLSFILLLVSLGWSFFQLQNVKHSDDIIDSIQVNHLVRDSLRDQYFVHREDRTRLQWEESNAAIAESILQLTTNLPSDIDPRLVQRLQQGIENSADIFHRIAENWVILTSATGNRKIYEELDKRLASQLLVKDAATQDLVNLLQKSSASKLAASDRQLVVTFGVCTLFLAISITFLSVSIGRLIRERLASLHHGAQSIANGNLNYRFKNIGTDEFADLARAFNAMTDNLLRAQNQLQASGIAHQETLARLEKIANRVPGVVYQYRMRPDGTSNFPYASPAIQEIYRVSPDQALADASHTFAIVHPADRDAMRASMQASSRDLTPWRHEYRTQFSDGTGSWLLGNALPEREPDGSTLWHGFITDITAQKQQELALIAATRAAEAANIAKSRFLATMSHEIRTPMNGILGMAQLLLMPSLQDSQRTNYARTILTSGQTLLTLLNDILDFSKIEAGKLQLEATVFQPTQLIQETHTLFEETANGKNLRLESTWHGAVDQRYQADAHRLRQMLSNLVGNAIKFTASGQVHMEASELERDMGSALLEFSVTDSGIGIPTDKLGLLFKPFSQSDTSTTRQFGGTGLGLSIVSSIAKLMGGDVGVESVSGKGSRFWFRIRAGLVATGENSRQAQRVSQQPATTARLRGRVLVIEDNLTNRMVIEAFLTSLGLTVTLANDGAQGVGVITQGELPDLVLMDLQMPVLDGYAATEQIRAWEIKNNRPRLPIIALTANAFDEDRQHCLAVGMDDFLAKPIQITALTTALSQWLHAGTT